MVVYKSNINCDACIAKVQTALDGLAGPGKWSVNITDRNKPLSLEGDLDAAQINSVLEPLGYRVSPLPEAEKK